MPSNNKLQEGGMSSPCKKRLTTSHELLTNRFHVSHYADCAVLFNKDTSTPTSVSSPSTFMTQDEIWQVVMEGEHGWVLQGVLSRAIFRRPPVSRQKYFTVLSLHISNIYDRKKGIAKKLILTLRATMVSQEVDRLGYRAETTSVLLTKHSWTVSCLNHRTPTTVVTRFHSGQMCRRLRISQNLLALNVFGKSTNVVHFPSHKIPRSTSHRSKLPSRNLASFGLC